MNLSAPFSSFVASTANEKVAVRVSLVKDAGGQYACSALR
jgi:hypothetical protein